MASPMMMMGGGMMGTGLMPGGGVMGGNTMGQGMPMMPGAMMKAGCNCCVMMSGMLVCCS